MAGGRSVKRSGVRDSARRTGEILNAAAAAFAADGFHGATTQDIADRLGIRQASVYYYVRDKQAALEQVCAIAIGILLDGGRQVIATAMAPQDKLRAIVRNHLVSMIDTPDYARVFMTQRRFLTGAGRERIRRLSREYEQIVTMVIEEGARASVFRVDLRARDLMLATIGLCNTANLWQGVVPGMSVDKALRIVSVLLVDGLSGHATPSTLEHRHCALPVSAAQRVSP